MSKLKLECGQIVDTERALKSYEENTYWDGHNLISCATASQWSHETLYLSRKGFWYLVTSSQYESNRPYGLTLSQESAVTWLILNDHQIPASLAAIADEMIG